MLAERFTLSENVLDLALELEDAQALLMGAEQAYCEMTEKLNDAKQVLELKLAAERIKGVEGKNAEERDARLKLMFETDYQEVHMFSQRQLILKHELEQASLCYKTLTYKLRAYEVMATLKGCG